MLPNHFDATCYRIIAPEGTANIILTESTTGKLIRVDVYIGKAGTSIRAWTESLCTLINRALANNVSPMDIVSDFLSQTSDKTVTNFSGDYGRYKCGSGPEAIALAILRWITEKRVVSDNEKILGYNPSVGYLNKDPFDEIIDQLETDEGGSLV